MLRAPPEFDRFSAIEALDRLVRQGWTLAIPAFTFSFCRGRAFERYRSGSEVGSLADYVLADMPQANRTSHPIYSFVVIGARSAEILACLGDTTFGAGTPFELFERSNAQLVMLGCGWSYCTQFHRYEELAHVPYRYFKSFEGQADLGSGLVRAAAAMFVRDLDVDPHNDFTRPIVALRAAGKLRDRQLWQGHVEACSCRDLAEATSSVLEADRYGLLREGAAVERAVSNRAIIRSAAPIRIALLGHANLDLLSAALREVLMSALGGRAVEMFALPFGQLEQNVLTPNSALIAFEPEHVFFLDRVEDLLGEIDVGRNDLPTLSQKVALYGALIRKVRTQVTARLYIARFAPLRTTTDPAPAVAALFAELNEDLAAAVADIPDLSWVEIAQQAASASVAATDSRLWCLGRFPFSDSFSKHLARHLAGLILAAIGRSARLIVLDLDNTLWSGVLGEDGLDGIQIGGDYPGNAFHAFQRALRQLSERGIALAVASKNDEDLALEALARPEMVIKATDLVGHRIGWLPKSDGIQSLCEQLGLGLASVLFVDDNPVEREAVRRTLPDVAVLDLPADPADYVDALARSPFLTVLDVTNEDLQRIQSYRTRAKIAQQKAETANLDNFLASLEMTLHFRALDGDNIVRAAQLCAKTNQFNTTTKRYSPTELRQLADQGANVIVIGLSEHGNEPENIGLLILRADDEAGIGTVDLFLLSCRVLGRGLETAIARWAIMRARALGWRELRGEIIETERNTPARTVFRDAGYRDNGLSSWAISTASEAELPAWLKIDVRLPLPSDKTG